MILLSVPQFDCLVVYKSDDAIILLEDLIMFFKSAIIPILHKPSPGDLILEKSVNVICI